MAESSISKHTFGKTKDGIPVERYTLQNESDLRVEILTFGGVIHSLYAPDRKGQFADIVTGYDSVQGYEDGNAYFGGLIGRVANRIKGGKFSLDGKDYQLPINDGPNALHGGFVGFDKKLWRANVEGDRLKLTYFSADGEEGYPGELDVAVTFQLTSDNQLRIEYLATTSKPTPINLTSHPYFNLSGHNHGDIYEHVIMIPSEKFIPKDENNIPTGEIAPVKGTVFDLRAGVQFGKQIHEVSGDLGYDHTFCVPGDGDRKFAGCVTDAASGRKLECFTSAPGVHLYTGNYFGFAGKGGARYNNHAAFTLETQNYANAINQPNFPNSVLRPGETYRHSTWFKFSTF